MSACCINPSVIAHHHSSSRFPADSIQLSRHLAQNTWTEAACLTGVVTDISLDAEQKTRLDTERKYSGTNRDTTGLVETARDLTGQAQRAQKAQQT